MDAILAEQVEPALALRPDLVIDLRRRQRHPAARRSSIDALVAAVRRGGRPAGRHAGRTSCCSPASTSASHRCSGTCADASRPTTSWSARSPTTTARRIVDFWRLREYRDPRLWDVDRLHMSSAGHQRMAIAVLDALGVEHDLVPFDLAPLPEMDRRQRRDADLAWARAHAAPVGAAPAAGHVLRRRAPAPPAGLAPVVPSRVA